MSIPTVPDLEVGHPRIHKLITTTWGSSECRAYMVSLGMEDRNNHIFNYHGFDFHIITELNTLIDAHDQQFPKFKPSDVPFTCY